MIVVKGDVQHDSEASLRHRGGRQLPAAAGRCPPPLPHALTGPPRHGAGRLRRGAVEAVYARQSIDKKDSVSIETQISHCRRYTDDEPEIFQDKGFSGKNTNRPAFQRLMEEVEAGRVAKIIVYRLDRFSRSIADFGQVWTVLERHGVEFQSVTENFDTSSPMGRAMLNIVLVFAQLERETIAERVRDNYQHRFALGAWPGGPAPYGYSLAKITDGEGRRASSLAANENAPVVRRIFEAYAQEGASLRGVARRLNEDGVAGPKRGTWDNVTLSRILRSPLYVQATQDVYWWYLSKGLQPKQEADAFDGRHACNVIGRRDRSGGRVQELSQRHFSLSNHQGIVPAELWLRCQAKLERGRQVCSNSAAKHSWLTGLLKCGCCGYAVKVVRDSRGGKLYLCCSGRSNMGVCHQQIRVDVRELEAAVAQELCRMLAACPAEEAGPPEREGAGEIGRIEERIERLVAALSESGAVPAAYISAQIERLHSRREQLLEELQKKKGRGQKRRLDFERADFEEKRLIAGEFVEKILLQDDCADVIWKV